MTKPLFIIIFVLVFGLILLSVFLPSKRSATKSVSFAFTCDEVWNVYSTVENQIEWRSDIKSVEMLSTAAPRRWLESPKNGPPIEFSETSSVPGSEIVLDIKSGSYFRGTYTARFDATEYGCIGTFTESVELLNPISKLMSYAFFSPGSSIEKYARDATRFLQMSGK